VDLEMRSMEEPTTDTESHGTAADGRVALVQGANRGIGLAIARALLGHEGYAHVFATCRSPDSAAQLNALHSSAESLHVLRLDVLDEASIAASAQEVSRIAGRLDLLINCAGVLHQEGRLWPEKRLADVEPRGVTEAFRVNALGPLLVARAFESVLKSGSDARFVALSARVGSIGDNRRGGWYAYRASKAALNMMIRTLSLEWARLPRRISCFVVHPGTVATDLSLPFRGRLSSTQVFTPQQAAEKLLRTIHALRGEDTGGFYAYDGKQIPW
jgi:NAD(P)-dependent dehydrogenase (short-subunit alcohol dehydrogenase family)